MSLNSHITNPAASSELRKDTSNHIILQLWFGAQWQETRLTRFKLRRKLLTSVMVRRMMRGRYVVRLGGRLLG